MTQTNAQLPPWQHLCSFKNTLRIDEEDIKEVEFVKSASPPLLFRATRWIVTILPIDPTYKKFLRFTWGQLVDIVYDLAARNRAVARLTNSPFPTSGPSGKRRYHQMPCTERTTQARVAEAKKLCRLDDPILVIGDDDMVGIELMRAGFSDVTSVDIDPAICANLSRVAREHGVDFKVVLHDITQPAPRGLVRSYRLVFFDPPYCLQGVSEFLLGALKVVNPDVPVLLFLSFHLLSLSESGIEEFDRLLARHRLVVRKFVSGFNIYPIPVIPGKALTFLARLMLRTKFLAAARYRFSYVSSDALVLERLSRGSSCEYAG